MRCTYCDNTENFEYPYDEPYVICTDCGSTLDADAADDAIAVLQPTIVGPVDPAFCRMRTDLDGTIERIQDALSWGCSPDIIKQFNVPAPTVSKPTRKKGVPKRTNSKYVRRVHITERLRFGSRMDKLLPDEDSAILREFHLLFEQRDFFYYCRSQAKQLLKRDIQKLLRFIDVELWRKEKKAENPDHQFTPEEKRMSMKHWCKKYLEQWNYIACYLTGTEYPVYSRKEAEQVGAMMVLLSNIWDQWQPPDTPKDQRNDIFRFTDRKHFPNFNFVFQKINDLLGLSHMNTYFPIPTTKASLKKLKVFWNQLAAELEIIKKDPLQLQIASGLELVKGDPLQLQIELLTQEPPKRLSPDRTSPSAKRQAVISTYFEVKNSQAWPLSINLRI